MTHTLTVAQNIIVKDLPNENLQEQPIERAISKGEGEGLNLAYHLRRRLYLEGVGAGENMSSSSLSGEGFFCGLYL
jgi:hypothetical protein